MTDEWGDFQEQWRFHMDTDFCHHTEDEHDLHGDLAENPYGEDGYCCWCGNGHWKLHAPWCDWQDRKEAAVNLDRLEELARAAIHDGPMLTSEYIDGGGPWPVLSGGAPNVEVVDDGHWEQAHADAEFVEAASPDVVLALVGIVRDLARGDPLGWCREDPSGCVFCPADETMGTPPPAEKHDPTCPWRRAVEVTEGT